MILGVGDKMYFPVGGGEKEEKVGKAVDLSLRSTGFLLSSFMKSTPEKRKEREYVRAYTMEAAAGVSKNA